MLKFFRSPYLPEPANPHALNPEAPHSPEAPLGVLVVNLGTPDQPTPSAIRRYLLEFLSDRRVIEIPSLIWQPLLRTVVLARRPHKLAVRYKEIWLKEGSPLLVWSAAQANGIQQVLQEENINAKVMLAMRYGNPSLPLAMETFKEMGCEKILVLPLYPQYAASTTATVVDKITTYMKSRRNQPELRFVKRYHNDEGYLNALAQKIENHWAKYGLPERLLLSYHGLPKRAIELGDPYYRDCMQTTAALKQRLAKYNIPLYASFQSRFGAQAWLQPYTEPTLREWAREGIKHVHVTCPGFLADCLETLEEIQIQCRDVFLAEGGETFQYIACLNNDKEWIQALANIAKTNLAGWM